MQATAEPGYSKRCSITAHLPYPGSLFFKINYYTLSSLKYACRTLEEFAANQHTIKMMQDKHKKINLTA